MCISFEKPIPIIFFLKSGEAKTDIQAVRKQTYPLHSQTVQVIADKYVANRETIRQIRQIDKKAKYPWRTKYFYYIPLKKVSAVEWSVSSDLDSLANLFTTNPTFRKSYALILKIWRLEKYS